MALLLMPGYPDYFAILFGILSMQIMQRLDPKSGALGIGLFALLTMMALVKTYGLSQAVAFALIYIAVNAFLGSYALTTQRAQAARARNQALVQELQATNRQLQAYSKQVEQLVVARERHHLARELHDSVTQTIFSMTLTTQSAALLLEHDPNRVGEQLDRLNQLAHSALSEMHVLISELRWRRASAYLPCGATPAAQGVQRICNRTILGRPRFDRHRRFVSNLLDDVLHGSCGNSNRGTTKKQGTLGSVRADFPPTLLARTCTQPRLLC